MEWFGVLPMETQPLVSAAELEIWQRAGNL